MENGWSMCQKIRFNNFLVIRIVCKLFLLYFCSSLCEVDFDAAPENEEWATENDMRKKRLAAQDVVYTVDLHQLFRNEVGNLRLRLGEPTFTEVMSTVDVETMQMVKSHLE